MRRRTTECGPKEVSRRGQRWTRRGPRAARIASAGKSAAWRPRSCALHTRGTHKHHALAGCSTACPYANGQITVPGSAAKPVGDIGAHAKLGLRPWWAGACACRGARRCMQMGVSTRALHRTKLHMLQTAVLQGASLYPCHRASRKDRCTGMDLHRALDAAYEAHQPLHRLYTAVHSGSA